MSNLQTFIVFLCIGVAMGTGVTALKLQADDARARACERAIDRSVFDGKTHYSVLEFPACTYLLERKNHP